MNQSVYYAQLEQGARYLAARAQDEAERRLHLGWANRYCRLAGEYGSAVTEYASTVTAAAGPKPTAPSAPQPLRIAPALFS